MTLTGCCCCSLRTGGMIIGWVGTCYGLIALASWIAFNPTSREFDHLNVDVKSVKITAITMSVISILMHVLLIVGIHKDKPMLLVAWLTSSMIKIVGLCIIFLIVCCIAIINNMGSLFGIALLVGVFTALYIYFWACIQALFRELRLLESRKTNSGDDEICIARTEFNDNYNNPPPYNMPS